MAAIVAEPPIRSGGNYPIGTLAWAQSKRGNGVALDVAQNVYHADRYRVGCSGLARSFLLVAVASIERPQQRSLITRASASDQVDATRRRIRCRRDPSSQE